MKLAVDPGHGMSNVKRGVYDPGAVHKEDGFQFEEATIVLSYGLTLRDAFVSRDVEVFMTRDDQNDHAPVRERAANAKAAGAAGLISLHLNSVEDDRAHGLEVLYGSPANEPLARAMQKALIKETGFRDRAAKLRTDLAVLKFKGPAILIELGFIGNDKDREVLINPARRSSFCRVIAETAIALAKLQPK
jgi:N-acetylmuramoyl-L-alanine amidase